MVLFSERKPRSADSNDSDDNDDDSGIFGLLIDTHPQST